MRRVATLWLAALVFTCSVPLFGGDKIPDLLKGEGPSLEEIAKARAAWYLHFYGTSGWIYGHLTADANKARQLLVTRVPEDSAVAGQLQVGDVILGVNGKLFSKHPVYQFREHSFPATKADQGLTLIMWRKGWDKPRTVEIKPKSKMPDFTKGDTVDLTKKGMTVDRNLGATGARGWIYGKTLRARQILITKVHKGSPAEGVLKKDDVILGTFGKNFSYDARKEFGLALTKAETRESNGGLPIVRWRAGKTDNVIVQMNVMGSYGKTTPWECEKSGKIIDNACAYLVRNGMSLRSTFSVPSLVSSLALLSTGNKNYLPVVREHIAAIVKQVEKSGDRPPTPYYATWSWGYTSLLLCEYHLATKDESVLPAISKFAVAIALGQGNNGNWGHGMAPIDKFTGKPHGELGGYGAVNQCSTICWMALLLAKRCGVNDAEVEMAIRKGHKFLSYFVDLGTVTYGNNFTGGFQHDDNGKTSAAAVAFSIYGDKPATRFCSRMTVASHSVRERGHTGNYWSFLWGALGAARSGQPALSAFLDQDSWRYDLERRWDGGFEYQGKIWVANGIDPKSGRQRSMSEHTTPHWDTTGARVLMYCLARKHLVITGRETTTAVLTAAEVADTIEAGTCQAGTERVSKLEKRSAPQLLKLLGSWSPVVRSQAAHALSKKKAKPVAELRQMLQSSDRFAQYGACAGLLSLGSASKPAVTDLIKCLDNKDLILQVNAIKALGTTDDMRAVKALVKMVDREFADDPYDIRRRYIADSLFGRQNSLVEKTRASKDRVAMLKAAQRLMRSITGHCRSVVGQNLVHTLSLDEAKSVWPDLDYAFYSTATTYNTAIQLATLELMAKYRMREGMDRCVSYLTNMRGHGSEKRVPKVLEILLKYGPHAKATIPRLEEVADYFENREKDFPKNLSIGKAKAVRETIEKLKAMDDAGKAKIKLIAAPGK